MKNIIFFSVFFCVLFCQQKTLIAQSTTCNASSELLTPSATCTATTETLGTFPNTTDICLGGSSRQGFYRFVATATSHTIIVNGNNNVDAIINVGTACGSIGNLASCVDATGNNGIETAVVSGLTIGVTYFIAVRNLNSPGGNGANNNGFTICVVTPPAAPANDNCSGAISLTQTALGTCTNTAGTVASATTSAEANACPGSADDDVWYRFVATAVNAQIQTSSVAGSAISHSVYAGACGAVGAPLVCSVPNTSNVTGLTIGLTYFVRVYTTTATAGQTTTFNICITTPPVVPTPPVNDTCAGVVVVVQTAFGACTATAGTVSGATQTIAPCIGAGTTDVWYRFVATATTAIIRRTAGFDSVLQVMTGCGTGSLLCADPEGDQTITGLTIGTTYYYRIYYYFTGTPATSTFTTCVTQPPPPITNNECTGAINVVVPAPGGGCNSVGGTIIGATGSAQANTCTGTANDDVWFSFIATSTAISIALNNVGGSTTDLVHSVYAGTCVAIGTPLVCSDPNTSAVSGLTIGNPYFVRIYSWTATTGQTTTFDLCITAVGACGNAANNDYCSNPAILTIGVGNFDSSTSSTYSADSPANTSTVFCGSIENNSWYQFTATQTTHVFNFTSVTSCASGIQAQVYEVTRDVDGCCTNLTSRSNCFNPATASTGAVNATGLTIGAQYIIMIDGFAGAQCNFRVAGWTAVGVLPVDLLTFTGIALPNGNKLVWETIAERNNKQFEIQKSIDVTNWETIGTVAGAGTSDIINSYSFVDANVTGTINYYRLKQIDKNGEFKYSNIVSIKNRIENTIISVPRPNPATSFIEIDISTQNTENIDIKVVDMLGRTLINQTKLLTNGFQTANINIEKLNNGFHTIIITNNKDIKKAFKFVKLD